MSFFALSLEVFRKLSSNDKSNIKGVDSVLYHVEENLAGLAETLESHWKPVVNKIG